MITVLNVVNCWSVISLNISSSMHRALNDSKVLIHPVHISTGFGVDHKRNNLNIEWLCENFRIVKRMCKLLGNVETHKLIN